MSDSYHRISGFKKSGLWLSGSGNGSSFAMSNILLKDEGVLIGMSDSHKNPEENIKLSVLNNGKVIIYNRLEIKGAAVVRGNIGLFGTDPDASVPNDGFRFRFNGNFFGTNLDAMIFEKTDGNHVNPDGGIAFVNRGKDGIPETAMVIKGNGNIGIGTLSPTHKLHINGSAYCTSGTWTASDIRFKENIKPIQNVLPKITLLQSVSYDMKITEFPEKNFPESKQIGFVADEVEKVFPELVHADDEGIKSISYDKISVLNTEAIKELYQLVMTIQEHNKQNIMVITKLEAENERLRKKILKTNCYY
ncbi:conserved hypothetical protein, secreted [Candidatus Magnetomorum sp. HK-1]|nr:conserved hypothetical protein, secreted [Candidatus Magnetomorum sp. HK-1]